MLPASWFNRSSLGNQGAAALLHLGRVQVMLSAISTNMVLTVLVWRATGRGLVAFNASNPATPCRVEDASRSLGALPSDRSS